MKTKKKLLRTAIIATCAGFAGTALGGLIVTFDQQSAFLFENTGDPEDIPLPGDADIGVHGVVNDRVEGYESLWWPANEDPGGRGTESDDSPIDITVLDAPTAPPVEVDDDVQDPVSALRVEGQSGFLDVPEDGTWSDAEILSYSYHRNNPISGDTPVAGVIVDSTIFGYDGDEQEDMGELPFVFLETSNNPAGDNIPENCSNGAPNNTVCDDLFIVPLASFDPVPITIGGVKFEFFFDIVPGPTAETNLAECRADINDCDIFEVNGQEIPFFTIWTGESSLNYITTTVSARLAPVPAPGALSLMGLGLVGMGFALRRRRKSD